MLSLSRSVIAVALIAACVPRSEVGPGGSAPPSKETTPPTKPTLAPGLCSASGWCWYHPTPQGNRLDTLLGTTSEQVWATGLDTLLRFDGQRWERVAATPADTWFRQLAPRATGGFWALGRRGDGSALQGLLYAWDGRQWLDSGLRTRELQAMFVADDRDIWLVSDDGVLSRWDGQALREVPSPTREYTRALAGTAENDVWLAASDGLFHWDGRSWSKARPTSNSVLVRGIGDVWSVDDDGVHHLVGATWRSWSLAPDPMRRVYDGGDGSVWLVESRAAFRLAGDTWERTTSADLRVDTLSAAPDGIAWALVDRVDLIRWDGTSWTQPIANDQLGELQAFWGVGDDDVWAAGEDGLVLHFDGRAWRRVPAPATASIRALWGSGPNDVWGVGSGLYHWDGRAWSRVPVHAWGGLDSVWGTGPNDVWAQGSDVVLHFDGCWWTVEFAEKRSYRNDGGAAGRGEVWAPLDLGIVRHRDRQRRLEAGVPRVRFTAIRGSEASGLWALGRQDNQWLLLSLAVDQRWTPAALPSTVREPRALHVQRSDAVYIADEDAVVYRWDGSTWHDETQDLLRHNPRALWVSPSGDLWLSGGVKGGLLGKRATTRASPPAPPPVAPLLPACGPDPTATALASALAAVDKTHQREGSRVTAAAAREVARVWLEAMGDMQPLALARATALPLTFDGIEASGDCGAPLVAQDVESFRGLLDCILALPLTTYVPRDARGGWTRGGASGQIRGAIRVIRPAGLAAPLARYRRTVEALAKAGHVLVQARMTDHNGVTNHAVLAVHATPSGPRVTTVLFHEHFEH